MAGSAISTPTAQLVNANVQNDGSADSPRGWAITSGASGYTFTSTGPSRVRYSSPSGGLCYVTLPKTNIKAGAEFEVLVTGATETNAVVVRSYGTTGTDGVELGTAGYGRIGGEGKITVIALVDSPSAQTDWAVVDVWERQSPTQNGSASVTATFSGGASVPHSGYYINRINKSVTVVWNSNVTSNAVNASGSLAIATLATRYRPTAEYSLTFPATTIAGTVIQTTLGLLSLLDNGALSAYKDYAGSNWVAGGYNGVEHAPVFSYTV